MLISLPKVYFAKIFKTIHSFAETATGAEGLLT